MSNQSIDTTGDKLTEQGQKPAMDLDTALRLAYGTNGKYSSMSGEISAGRITTVGGAAHGISYGDKEKGNPMEGFKSSLVPVEVKLRDKTTLVLITPKVYQGWIQVWAKKEGESDQCIYYKERGLLRTDAIQALGAEQQEVTIDLSPWPNHKFEITSSASSPVSKVPDLPHAVIAGGKEGEIAGLTHNLIKGELTQGDK